ALAVHFFDQPDELDPLAAEGAGCRDDLRPLDEFFPRDPEVEELARRFLVRRRGHLAERFRARRKRAGRSRWGRRWKFVGHAQGLPRTPACRRNRFRNRPNGVKRLFKLSSARTIGSSDTGILA